MSKRGSVEEKTVQFFTEAELPVAEAVFRIVKGIIKKRVGVGETPAPTRKPRRKRAPKSELEPASDLMRERG